MRRFVGISSALLALIIVLPACRILDDPGDVPLIYGDASVQDADMTTPVDMRRSDLGPDADSMDSGMSDASDTGFVDAAGDMPASVDMRGDSEFDQGDASVDAGPLPGPYGDVCPGNFEPPPGPELCDLILQDCSPPESTHCNIAIISQSPPEFEPRCANDGNASFDVPEGQQCDPAESATQCEKGQDCSQISGENRCRRYCILENARGCDPDSSASFCAPTGLTPLDINGIGFCAASCEMFQ